MRPVHERRVYVFGGSSGIGLAIAARFAREGAHVLIAARRLEPLARALARLEAARRHDTQRLATLSLDVSDAAAVARELGRVVASFGAPDGVVNAAGLATPRVFEEVSSEQFDRTLQVNLYGTRHTLAALLPHMKGPGARVVNVSSIAGLIGVFGYTDYSASKFAVVGFSEALRAELRPRGIRVSVLCPPDSDTPGFAEELKTRPAETSAIAGNVHLMSPEAVADALLSGMRRGRFLIIPGLDGRLSVLAKRLAPGLVSWVMDRAVARARR